MPQIKVHYNYVDMNNPHMKTAYLIARRLYDLNEWNEKACPVAVLVKDGNVIAAEASGNGMHQKEEFCARFEKPGAPYSDCRWCNEDEHAEQRLVRWLRDDVSGGDLYIYGHYRMCDACITVMRSKGIENYYLLEDADTLFNHHVEGSVIGKPEQFIY